MSEKAKTTPELQILPSDSSCTGGEEAYRVSLDLLPEAAILFSRDGTVLQANDAARLQFEAESVDEILGKNIYEFGIVTEELRRNAFEQIAAGRTIRFEMQFQTFKGNRCIFEILDIPLRNAAGEVETVLGFARDITAQRNAEAARDQLVAVLESSDDAIMSISPELRVLSWNRGAEQMLGYSRDEMVGNSVDVFLSPEFKPVARQMMLEDIERVSKDPSSVRRIEAQVRTKDGRIIDTSIVASGLFDSTGRLLGITAFHRDITETKRAERERTTLAAIVNASQDAIIGATKDLKILSMNAAAERAFGHTAQEAISGGFELLLPPEELAPALAAGREMLETGQPVTVEVRSRRKDGTWFTLHVSMFPVRDWAGNIVGGAGIGRDITELKRIQNELQAAQEYTRGLIDSSIDAMVVVDRDLRITDMNEQLAKMTEVPRNLLIGSRFDSYFADPERAAQAVDQTLADGFVTDFDLVLRAAGGKEVQVSFNASIFHSAGRVFGIFGVARDVTAQRATERTVREEREYSRSLVESSPDALLVCDTNLVLTDANEQAIQLTGFPRADLVGVKLPVLFSEFDRVLELAGQSAEGGMVRDLDLTLVAKTATRIPVSLNASVFRDAGGATRGMLVALRDVTDRKRFESERMLLASIVETSGDAIFTESPDLTITSWNAAAEKLFGYTADEAIGRNAALLVPLDRRGELVEQFHRLQQAGKSQRFETKRLRKDGVPVDVAVTASPITDSTGRLTAISITAHDISNTRLIEAELTKARDVALEAARLKSEFLANMSHEIRTPLNSIIGMTGLLLDTALSPEQHEYANDVRESGEVLLNLINEILDFSKIAAGKMVFEDISFELRTAVEGAVEMVADQARRKGLELTLSIDPDVPHLLHGDSARLRQVLLNLLANAIKFTEHGEVAVAVNKLSENPREAVLRFEVRDTGIGIAEDKRHLLFQPFTQVDSSTSRHFGGTGLGLSIARKIVGRMGGTIAVNSTVGVGSTFWFTAKFGKQVDSNVPAAELLASLAGRRALVVDDNASSRNILSRELSSWGMEVKTAESASQALELMRAAAPSNPFAVAIVDVMMPELDGIELARMIAGDPTIRATKVVLISSVGARSEFNTRLRGLPIGGWLMKPVPQSSLYDAVLKVVASPRANRTPPAQLGSAESVQPQAQAEAAAPRRKLSVLIAEDNLLNLKLAKLQLLKLGIKADCAADGREAVTAVARRPYDLVLMDCQMPMMDGYQATQKIRRNERGGRRAKIIAMTAHALKGDREKCIAAGMDGYLSKPVDLRKLEKVLDELAAAPEGSAGAPQPGAPVPSNPAAAVDATPANPPPPEAKGAPQQAAPLAATMQTPDRGGNGTLDGHAIADLRAEGEGLLDELIGMLLEQMPVALTAVADALACKDSQAIAFQAHKLKGGVSNFGARAMSELCQSLETAAKAGDFAQAESKFSRLKAEAERVGHALEQERAAAPGTPGASAA
jgi:two-component system sensor histidine kinase/response regulator